MRSVIAIVLFCAVVASATSVSSSCQKPCKSTGSKVLFWGLTPGNGSPQTIVQWLNANIANATFDQKDPASNTLTASLLASYDLLVLSEIFRPASTAEAQALANWVNNLGGFFFGMSGWYNNGDEVSYTNSYLSGLLGSPQYYCAPTGDCTVSGCDSFAPNQPLLAKISQCNIDFLGGYPGAYPVSLAGDFDYAYLMHTTYNGKSYNLGLSVDLCASGYTNGGRYVLWGDEWISYTSRFNVVAGDEQIWFNIINYLGVCVAQAGCDSDADCPFAGCVPQTCTSSGGCIPCRSESCGVKVVSTTCSAGTETYHSSGNFASLAFDPLATSC